MTEVASTHTTVSPDETPFGARRPGTLRYRTLVAGLQEWPTAVDDTGTPARPLHVATMDLAEILQFLQSDPEIEPETLRPLRMLFVALQDKVQGGTVEWLENPLRPSGATKPTNRFWYMVRGSIVGALNRVITAGMRPPEAAKWLASEIARLGIMNPPALEKLAPTSITAKQCLTWRSRVNDRKAPSAQRMAAEAFAGRCPKSLAEAKADALEILGNARNFDFAESPAHTAKEKSATSPSGAAFGVSKRKRQP